MVLWTIQHRAAYERMLKIGTLRADERYILWGKEFLEAYRWLSDQMRTRIGLPPAGVRFPVWAWYQWEGVRARPDMRSFLWHWAPKGTPVVLMTVDVPDAQVLLSDFDYWNAVMCLIFPYSDTAVIRRRKPAKAGRTSLTSPAALTASCRSLSARRRPCGKSKRQYHRSARADTVLAGRNAPILRQAP